MPCENFFTYRLRRAASPVTIWQFLKKALTVFFFLVANVAKQIYTKITKFKRIDLLNRLVAKQTRFQLL